MFSDELEKISWEETTKPSIQTDADVRRALSKDTRCKDFMALISPLPLHIWRRWHVSAGSIRWNASEKQSQCSCLSILQILVQTRVYTAALTTTTR